MMDYKQLVNITNQVRLEEHHRKEAQDILRAVKRKEADVADIFELSNILVRYNKDVRPEARWHPLMHGFGIVEAVDKLNKLIQS